MLSILKKLNNFPIYSIYDNIFKYYGAVIKNLNTNNLIGYMEKNTEIPKESNIYIPSSADMEIYPEKSEIENMFYKGDKIQIGYCNGNNFSLGALEFHNCSEIIITATNLVLFLALKSDMNGNIIDTADVKTFYLPKGIAVELYHTTLHYSPCKVTDNGFKAVIVLLKGTNTDFINTNQSTTSDDNLLYRTNKWLIVHPDRTDLIEKGAIQGIKGNNLILKYQ